MNNNQIPKNMIPLATMLCASSAFIIGLFSGLLLSWKLRVIVSYDKGFADGEKYGVESADRLAEQRILVNFPSAIDSENGWGNGDGARPHGRGTQPAVAKSNE
jgi:hypothetical protein